MFAYLKIAITVAVVLFSCGAQAQNFAVIKEKHGVVNIRSDKNNSSKIIGKLNANAIFSIDSDAGKNTDWFKIFYAKTLTDGYVLKREIISLSSFKHLTAMVSNGNLAIIKNDSVIIEVTISNFIAKKHILTKNKTNSRFYEKIDNSPIWGTDGGLPKKAIESLHIKLNGIALLIPNSATDNLFEPNLSTLTAYFGSANTIYIRMDNSDGAGGYTVIWVFKNGRYMNRFVDNSDA